MPDVPIDTHPPVTRRELLAGIGASSALALLAQSSSAEEDLPLSSRELWGWVRNQQVIDPDLVWLDTGRMGPTLRSVLVAEYRAREALNLDFNDYLRRSQSAEAVASLAGRVAAFVGADVDEIALTSGATAAINVVTGGLELAGGDEVVTTSQDHPAVRAAWAQRARRSGIVVREVPLPSPLTGPEQALGLIAGAVNDKTRVISFAHLQFADGALLPAREICSFARQRGILTFVDGAQALGMVDMSLGDLGCDAWVASLHKWINGTYGTGVLYLRRDLIDRVAPLEADGATANLAGGIEPGDPRGDWPTAMRRYGHAYHSYGPLFQPLAALLDLHERLGRSRIEARVRELAIYTRLRLQAMPGIELVTPGAPGLWGGILSLRPGSTPATDLARTLASEDRVAVGAVHAPDGSGDLLRISTHIYNDHDQIERLVRGLQRRVKA
jgi:selenocysteine lyase/cysteine desulfurase